MIVAFFVYTALVLFAVLFLFNVFMNVCVDKTKMDQTKPVWSELFKYFKGER